MPLLARCGPPELPAKGMVAAISVRTSVLGQNSPIRRGSLSRHHEPAGFLGGLLEFNAGSRGGLAAPASGIATLDAPRLLQGMWTSRLESHTKNW
jgi:hypothetical protein